MAKYYGLKFGTGDPRLNTGLSPTFVLFYDYNSGQTLAPPGITELVSGSGQYRFQYGPTTAIRFLADGGAILSATDRYIDGILDPIQAVDEKVGTTLDSFGSTATDPTTVLGYLKRTQEMLEGDAVYAKSTGIWSIYSRGSSTLLKTKTLTNTTTQAAKS